MPPPKTHVKCSPVAQALCAPQQPRRDDRTIVEQRAVLGAFVITSMFASYFRLFSWAIYPSEITDLTLRVSHKLKSADGLRWSPHLDEYLDNLACHSTVPQDKDLDAQAKMQLIFNQVRYASENGNAEIPFSYMEVLQIQLDDIAKTANDTNTAFANSCKSARARFEPA